MTSATMRGIGQAITSEATRKTPKLWPLRPAKRATSTAGISQKTMSTIRKAASCTGCDMNMILHRTIRSALRRIVSLRLVSRG